MENYTEEEKEFIINICGECNNLYTCDNNAHEKMWKKYMKNGKMKL